MSDKGRPLPKFGEWDVNDPASAEGFTVIFNKARDEKKTGGKPESPSKADPNMKYAVDPLKPQAVNKTGESKEPSATVTCESRTFIFPITLHENRVQKKWFCCANGSLAES